MITIIVLLVVTLKKVTRIEKWVKEKESEEFDKKNGIRRVGIKSSQIKRR